MLVCLLLSAVALQARPPVQPKSHQFNRLIQFSPFTIKPAKEAPVTVSPLEREWSLGSIRPSGDTYAVTLINKKDRKNRVRFLPGFSSGEYRLLEVRQDVKSPKMSKVLVQRGTQKGWVVYDAKVVAVRTSSAAKKPSPKKPTSSTSRRSSPPIPGKSSSGTSAPRVRHVPRTR